MNKFILEKIEQAPSTPGVYLFLAHKEVLYIGKAKDLKNRLKTYTTPVDDPRIITVIKKATTLDYIITGSEEEALLLEANLIKIHKPKYNIRLKDDKKYPYIKVTNEPYPAIALTRNLKEPNITIFGPYVNAQAVRKTIRAIRKIFPIRSCKYRLPLKRKISPCIDYQIGKCIAPCIKGKISEQDYRAIVENVVMFLRGKTEEVEKFLLKKMNEAVQNLEFEKATIFRDELLAIKKLTRSQAVHRFESEDKDVCVTYRIGKSAIAYLLKIRNGILVDTESYFLDIRTEDTEKEILIQFLSQYYSSSPNPPGKVIVEKPYEELELLSSALNIKFLSANIDDRRLIEMAYENARKELEEEIGKKKGVKNVHPGLIELSELLGLEKVPERIEACDISQLFGEERVGSFVCFIRKSLSKSNYRKYKIKGANIDDPHMIYEIVKRRLDNTPLPDIILIDGGLTQLNFAKKAKEEMNVQIPILAFAKRFDDLYLEDGRRIMIPKRSQLFPLLKILRDEAHRFALSYHRLLRRKKFSTPSLKIKGVKSSVLKELFEKYKNLEQIKSASIEELMQIKGVGRKTAERILQETNKVLRNQK
ncbi:MAG: excinuclease ABC subunit UvrC [candidate division WOR-3 bacterium]